MANIAEAIVTFVITQFHEHKEHLITFGLGMAVGVFAQMILPGRGFGLLATIAIGIAGCYLGQMFVGEYVEEYVTFTQSPTVHKIISGTIGAMAISVVANLFRMGKDKDKTAYRNNT